MARLAAVAVVAGTLLSAPWHCLLLLLACAGDGRVVWRSNQVNSDQKAIALPPQTQSLSFVSVCPTKLPGHSVFKCCSCASKLQAI